jgi:hypothetical protein
LNIFGPETIPELNEMVTALETDEDVTDLYAFPKPGDPRKSILIMNVHPSAFVSPPGPTTTEPFAPEGLYEFKIDTDGDAVADIAYRVRFSTLEGGRQTATLRRVVER